MTSHASETTGSRSLDIATKIAMTLRQMGLPGLPRNYELFYEAYTNGSQALIADIVDLGTRVTQEKLDAIGRKHLARNQGNELVESVREMIASKIDEVMLLLLKERKSLENYGKFLGETSSGINNKAAITREILEKIVDVMATATGTTIEHGRQIASSMADKTAELEKMKATLAEYKQLADTDPLTRINNRRAFDVALARLFDNNKAVLFGALIVLDIDDFKRINDTFGHPSGDRVLQCVAEILRAIAGSDIYVARTGGEEFALITDGVSEASVAALAERIRASIESYDFIDRRTAENLGPVTVSLGMCMAAEANSPGDLYEKADRAMYASKVGGRNRLTQHSQLGRGQMRKGWLLYKAE
jgi:diguanylate cyclase